MSYIIRRGIFIGIDDLPSANDALSIMAGSISATVLHAEFEGRCPDGKWDLLIPNNTVQITRSYLLGRLRQFLLDSVKIQPAVIYFAGHGCSFQGKYIFCPQDFRDELPDATGLTLELLIAMILRLCPERHQLIIIFDTCRTLNDKVAEVGEAVPPQCTVVYTCEHGKPVIEIDGYSDFVRSFLRHITSATTANREGPSRLNIAEIFDDMQTSRSEVGSGHLLRIIVTGQTFEDCYLLMRSKPTLAIQKTVKGQLISRPKDPGSCGRFRGEMLNKITHTIGIPMDPNIVEIRKANTSGSEIMRVHLPLTWPVKNARVLAFIVREWSYLFTDLQLSIPSNAVEGRLSRVLRTYGFDIWSPEAKTMAIKKLGAVAAKIEYSVVGRNKCEICLSCLGEEEKRGLERLDDLFFPLVRDLIEIGVSA